MTALTAGLAMYPSTRVYAESPDDILHPVRVRDQPTVSFSSLNLRRLETAQP